MCVGGGGRAGHGRLKILSGEPAGVCVSNPGKPIFLFLFFKGGGEILKCTVHNPGGARGARAGGRINNIGLKFILTTSQPEFRIYLSLLILVLIKPRTPEMRNKY